MRTSAGSLHILRARPLLGRPFAPDEDQAGRDKVAVLTHRLWQRRFAGDPGIIGRAIRLNDENYYAVVGVLPPNFLPWERAEFVVPYALDSAERNRGMHYLQVLARLKRGVTVEQASAELNTVTDRIRPLLPAQKRQWGVTVVPLHEQVTGTIRPTLLVLLGAVGFVLLIASANVANLFLINEALARELFANENPLGRGIVEGKQGWEIVGVVGNVRLRGLAEGIRPVVYRPQAFAPWNSGHFVVRTTVPPLALAEAIRKAIRDVDADQPVTNVRTLEDVIAASVAPRRLVLTLLAAFAGGALLLAGVGLYGVIAYAVAQRTREIGIRMALGAQRAQVQTLVVREGLRLAGIGVMLGLVGAVGLSRVIQGFLYGVKPNDPTTLAGVSLMLLFVAMLASWLPARKAARIDPMEAVR